jgi:hypothetical protein
MHSARAEASSAEVHLMKIKGIVREHQSRCLRARAVLQLPPSLGQILEELSFMSPRLMHEGKCLTRL